MEIEYIKLTVTLRVLDHPDEFPYTYTAFSQQSWAEVYISV